MQPLSDRANERAKQTVLDNVRRRRLLVAAIILYLLSIALLTGYACSPVQYDAKMSDAEKLLRTTIEETDRLDPGWRLNDLQAKRTVVPDAENSALYVLAACERLPKDWPGQKPEIGVLLQRLWGARRLPCLARKWNAWC